MPKTIPDDELRKGLQSFAETLGKKPTQREMREEGPYSINAYKRAFGSWNEALEAAGFTPRSQGQEIGREDLLEALQSLADELGKTPTQKEVNEQGEYSVGAYYTEFGSLNDAKQEVGLELNKENNVDRVRVACDHCDEAVERLPSQIKDNEFTYCSHECHYEHKQDRYSGAGNPRYNKTEVACDYCGDTLQRAQWELETNEHHFCDYHCMGRWRTKEKHPQWKKYEELECGHCGKAFKAKPSVADERRFCSHSCWYNERDHTGENNPMWDGGPVKKECEYCNETYHVKEAEADESKYCSASCRMSNRTGEDHPTYKGGHERLYYGPNWVEQRKKALLRDQARCQECSMTANESLEVYGKSLDVHHIEPLKEFQEGNEFDHDAANSLGNLVTLCREHHRECEAGALDVSA